LLEPIAKSVKRWHPKLQSQLKTDVPELPPSIEEAMKKQPPAPQPQKPAQEEQPQGEGRPPQPQQGEQRAERSQERLPREASPRQERKQQPPQSPAAKPQNAGRAPQGNFDLVSTLRQIEAHVQSLRSDLSQAKSELARQKEAPRGRGRDRDRDRRGDSPEPAAALEPTEVDALQRHNRQLEETVTELRKQLEELAADHEDIATSMQAHSETPVVDEKEQLKALLAIKLKDNYAEFESLAKEPADEVFREHYRILLDEVFTELKKQGIVLGGG
jgi:hypothetical protein